MYDIFSSLPTPLNLTNALKQQIRTDLKEKMNKLELAGYLLLHRISVKITNNKDEMISLAIESLIQRGISQPVPPPVPVELIDPIDFKDRPQVEQQHLQDLLMSRTQAELLQLLVLRQLKFPGKMNKPDLVHHLISSWKGVSPAGRDNEIRWGSVPTISDSMLNNYKWLKQQQYRLYLETIYNIEAQKELLKADGFKRALRNPNIPETITEFIAYLNFRKQGFLADYFSVKSGDLYVSMIDPALITDDSPLYKLQVKAMKSKGPSSFGPKTTFVAVCVVDVRPNPEASTANPYTVYLLYVASDDPILTNFKVSKDETFADKTNLNQRPRFEMDTYINHVRKINPELVEVIAEGDILEDLQPTSPLLFPAKLAPYTKIRKILERSTSYYREEFTPEGLRIHLDG